VVKFHLFVAIEEENLSFTNLMHPVSVLSIFVKDGIRLDHIYLFNCATLLFYQSNIEEVEIILGKLISDAQINFHLLLKCLLLLFQCYILTADERKLVDLLPQIQHHVEQNCEFFLYNSSSQRSFMNVINAASCIRDHSFSAIPFKNIESNCKIMRQLNLYIYFMNSKKQREKNGMSSCFLESAQKILLLEVPLLKQVYSFFFYNNLSILNEDIQCNIAAKVYLLKSLEIRKKLNANQLGHVVINK
jgi:hypothetical protein